MPVRDGLDDLLADGDLRAVLQIVVRAHADLAQRIFELLAVEAAVRSLEGRIVHGQRGQLVLGQAEAEFAGLLVEHGAGDQLRQHLVLDAERLGLFAREAGAELLRHDRSWRS